MLTEPRQVVGENDRDSVLVPRLSVQAGHSPAERFGGMRVTGVEDLVRCGVIAGQGRLAPHRVVLSGDEGVVVDP